MTLSKSITCPRRSKGQASHVGARNSGNQHEFKKIANGRYLFAFAFSIRHFSYASLVRHPSVTAQQKTIGQVAELIRGGEVSELTVKDDKVTAKQRDNNIEIQSRQTDSGIIDTLRNLGVTTEQLSKVDIKVDEPKWWENWSGILLAVLPLILLGAFFYFILRQAQQRNQAFSFGKSRARMFTGDRPTITFADVAGSEEAKQELQEVVEFLKEPEKFAALGARIPKGSCWLARRAPARLF